MLVDRLRVQWLPWLLAAAMPLSASCGDRRLDNHAADACDVYRQQVAPVLIKRVPSEQDLKRRDEAIDRIERVTARSADDDLREAVEGLAQQVHQAVGPLAPMRVASVAMTVETACEPYDEREP